MAAFDTRDVRVGMDVFSADWIYLGTVQRVRLGPGAAARRSDDLMGDGSCVNGELLGPQPTMPLGNPGPWTQGAANAFGAVADDALPIGRGAIAVGRTPFPFTWRWIAVAEIQVVSLERLVLRRTAAELGARPPKRRGH
ncbi:MAG: hypothetical protein NZL87_05835 [Thermomicrobium sp.]|nr:hypothetical protein [Thermomicrobium sp.]MDW7982899.1 hypothetical protein [Thermomicrobium sp.]